jgi:hypothetical protein
MPTPHDWEYYRRRADQLRLAATGPLSQEDRDTLMYFADQFDTLAEDAKPEGGNGPPDK